MIEVMVVVCLIGVLAALLLSAVQYARESARRATCVNNLRQLGLAVHAYVATTGVLPAGGNGNGYSLHAAVLAELDQTPLFNAINFQVPAGRPATSDNPNLTAMSVVLSVFICPSDTPKTGGGGAWTSYAGNRGTGYQRRGHDGTFIVPNGRYIGLADIRDGSSNTTAVAEWTLGNGQPRVRDPRRLVFRVAEALTGADQLEVFAARCHDIDPIAAEISSSTKGQKWIIGDYIHTLYNHVQMINRKSCTNDGMVQEGAYSAGSLHAGGANALFGDAHVRFVRETIAPSVWTALGSRDGGEAITDDHY